MTKPLRAIFALFPLFSLLFLAGVSGVKAVDPVVPASGPASTPDVPSAPIPAATDSPVPASVPGDAAVPAAVPAASAAGGGTPVAVPDSKPAPTPTQRELIDKLDRSQVDRAIATVRSNSLGNAALTDDDLQRALLEGLIRRLSPGAQLVSGTAASQKGEVFPFLAEILDARVGYVRVGHMTAETLPQLDSTLGKFRAENIKAVVLDLRGMPVSADFELAAEFARRFCVKGKVIFTLQKPSAKQERIFTASQDPVFPGLLVVLVDAGTAGAPEALAAALRADANAMIVGTTTAGMAVEFAEFPLGGEQSVRVAVAEAILPDGKRIFPGGTVPDLQISMPTSVRDQIFRASREKGVSQFVFEVERPRMNEAALVANTNPEIETLQAAARDRNRSVVFDTQLQRAVDLVTALSLRNR